jgi:ribosomal protein L22
MAEEKKQEAKSVEVKNVEAKVEKKVEKKVEEKKVEKVSEKKSGKREEKQFASAKINQARISFKQSMILTDKIRGKRLSTAKKWLENLTEGLVNVEGRGSVETGKKFPTAAGKFLEAIQSLESNAKVKNMNVDKLFLVKAHANAGQTFYRPKSRLKLRGRKAKSTNLTLVAMER